MLLGLWAGKLAGWISRKLGHNGTNVPGRIGLKLDPSLLEHLAKQVENIIVVTGTNGKTTTSHLIFQMLHAAQLNVMGNREGSNLSTGITSVFMKEANLFGRIRNVDAAVIEVDEGNLPLVLEHLSPKALVVTNFFRDQLDRYAEIDQLINKIKAAIHEVDTHLYLNADDPLTVRLAEGEKLVTYFGINKDAYTFHEHSLSESKYCVCGQVLQYDAVHYGQLGYYHCSCGFQRPVPSTLVQFIDAENHIAIKVDNNMYYSHLRGAYNAYNIAAAISSCMGAFDLSSTSIQQGLTDYIPDNGRMEHFSIYNQKYMLNLSKNAQGVNSTFEEYLKTTETKQFVLALNDLEADGQDISWIWDANYEQLNRDDVKRIICTGKRAYDLAIRIKYAGVDPQILETIPTLKEAVSRSIELAAPSYFICSYTTLKPMREILSHYEKAYMHKETV